MSAATLRLHDDDNVVIALQPLGSGIAGAVEQIPKSHKMAIQDIPAGANIRRYGQIIGGRMWPFPPERMCIATT